MLSNNLINSNMIFNTLCGSFWKRSVINRGKPILSLQQIAMVLGWALTSMPRNILFKYLGNLSTIAIRQIRLLWTEGIYSCSKQEIYLYTLYIYSPNCVGKKFIEKSIYIFDCDGIFENVQMTVQNPTQNQDRKGFHFHSRLMH